MVSKNVLAIAHRGLEVRAPENTLAAFKMALLEGADGVELDVQLTKDGEVAVIHDITLERTTNGSGKVRDKTLIELKRLDAGSWFDIWFSGERIPTLGEVFDALPKTAVLDIELKASGSSSRLPRKVVGIIERRHGEQRVIVSSYNPIALWHVRRINPRLKRKMIGLFEDANQNERLFNKFLLFLLKLIRKILVRFVRPDFIDINHQKVNQEMAEKIKRMKAAIIASILKNRLDMERILALDIPVVITTDPALFMRILHDA